jgi:hypothetical protein
MNTKDSATDSQLSEQEAAALIRGRKLGFLLAASALPEEVKNELAALAEDMSAEQQDRLLDVFEAKYLDEKTVEAENKLRQEVEGLVKKYQAEDEAQDKNLSAALSQI